MAGIIAPATKFTACVSNQKTTTFHNDYEKPRD